MADLTDEQIKGGIAAANAMDSTFEFGDGSTAAERETACIAAFRRGAQLPEWESYQVEGIGMVRRRKVPAEQCVEHGECFGGKCIHGVEGRKP